jgi:hypothetical protein
LIVLHEILRARKLVLSLQIKNEQKTAAFSHFIKIKVLSAYVPNTATAMLRSCSDRFASDREQQARGEKSAEQQAALELCSSVTAISEYC